MSLSIADYIATYIETGFADQNKSLVSIGKYSFSTQELCTSIQELAEQYTVQHKELTSFQLDKQVYKLNDHKQELFEQEIKLMINPSLYELRKKEQQEQLAQLQGRVTQADQLKKGRDVFFSISQKEIFMKVGDYIFTAHQFHHFLYYFTRGGWDGWIPEGPTFAIDAHRAMNNSQRPFFEKYHYNHKLNNNR